MIFLILAVFIYCSIYPAGALAAAVEISNPSSNMISSFDQEFEADVKLDISSPDGTLYYFRGLFYKSGTSDYCGETWDGEKWFNGPYTVNEGWSKLPEVTVSSGSASFRLKARLDVSDKNCWIPGEYEFKVRRYTTSGSSSLDDQTPLSLKVTVPEITPTVNPTSTKAPSRTPAAKETASSENKQSKPAASPPTATQLSPFVISVATFSATPGTLSALSASVPGVLSSASSPAVAGIISRKTVQFIYLPLITGILLIFSASFISYRKIIRRPRKVP